LLSWLLDSTSNPVCTRNTLLQTNPTSSQPLSTATPPSRNIVGCYGIGRISEAHPRHPSALFIVQQLVQGLTLATRVHMAAASGAMRPHAAPMRRPCGAHCGCGCGGAWYSDARALSWMLDVAEGLRYLHARQGDKPTIMHRDLKLENIMLDGPDGHALLVDFGLHRELDAR